MKRIISLAFFFCTALGLSAQSGGRVSGYLGKRIVLGVGADVSISNDPQKQSFHSTEGEFTLNRAFLGSLNYAIKNHITLGIRVGMQSTSSNLYEGIYANGVHWSDDEGNHRLNRVLGTPGIKDVYYGLNIKRFFLNKGGLAPVGLYFGLGFNIHNYQFDFSSLRYDVLTEDPWGETEETVLLYKTPTGTARFPEIYVELGRAIPLGERLLLDFSFKSGLLFNKYSDRPNINKAVTAEEFTTFEIKRRLRDLYIINCSVKLSVLL